MHNIYIHIYIYIERERDITLGGWTASAGAQGGTKRDPRDVGILSRPLRKMYTRV